MIKPLIIGISGGTGSGKTRFTKELIQRCDSNYVVYISQDSYYKDLSHMSYEERCNVNFDSPDSIDFKELYRDIKFIADDVSHMKDSELLGMFDFVISFGFIDKSVVSLNSVFNPDEVTPKYCLFLFASK